jgi:tetratricopeptide (TPR) repeat protein
MQVIRAGLCCAVFLLTACAGSGYKTAERYADRKEYNQAIRSYLKVLDPHSRDGKRFIYYEREAVTGIGEVYWLMQHYDTAIKILRMVIEKDPFYGKAHFILGLCHEALGNEDAAIQAYQREADLPETDPFRSVLKGRLDMILRNKYTREVQANIGNETFLNTSDIPRNNIAVLYFISLNEDPQWESLKKGFTDILIRDLASVGELRVTERLRLNALAEELGLASPTLLDRVEPGRLFKLLNVSTLIKGSYSILSDMRMTLDAGIIQAGSMGPPVIANFDGDLSRLFQIEKELLLRILAQLGIEITPQLRERLLEPPTRDMMAFVSYCRGLEAMDRYDYNSAVEFFNDALRMDPGFNLALEWVMSPQLWEITHNRNMLRVYYETKQIIETTASGKSRMVYSPSSDLVSTWSRLQWMGIRQNAGYLPSSDMRRSSIEAYDHGAPILPEILIEPPFPELAP